MSKTKSKPPAKKSGASSKAAPKKQSRNAVTWPSKLIRLAGLFGLLFSLFWIVAMISYVSGSWKSDDVFSGAGIGFNRIFFDSSLIVENWTGRIGAGLAHLFIKQWFGVISFVLPLNLFVISWWVLFRRILLPIGKTYIVSFVLLVLIPVGLNFLFPTNDLSILGGSYGHLVNTWLIAAIGKLGAGILIFFLYLACLILAFNVSLRWMFHKQDEAVTGESIIPDITAPPVMEGIQEEVQTIEFNLKEPEEIVRIEKPETVVETEEEPVLIEETIINKPPAKAKQHVEFSVNNEEGISEPENNKQNNIPDSEELIAETGTRIPDLDTPYDPRLDLSSYQFPPIELLNNYSAGVGTVKKEELEENKNKIVQTLNNYQISIDKIIATIGPTVTLYEIVPSPGVRISRIKNLEDDIALSLSAYGIRIIAPIPGKGTIGIEVPNQSPEIVSMRSIISSDKFQNSGFELPIGIGKTISNESFVTDLTKMPHLLMAGATGQGKSVGLNAIITSILYRKHPSEVKFVMVDPKKVELTLFSKIERHYLAKLPDYDEAIITDIRKVVRMLNSLCIEMDNRYNLLKDAQVRNIKEYNTKFMARRLNPLNGHKYLPYIVLIVDEFADLIMTAGKEIEAPITRLAQLARAIGIHLVIATQRPSVNIITGTIKANFPARLAFRVTSKIDSRTILDTGGADQLIGRGDLLLSTGNDLIRLQCAFVDTGEIEKITDFIGNQRGYPDAYHLPEYFEEGEEGKKDVDLSDRDELFEDAARMIVQYQQGSTSLLQRKMKLGYNRAGRIIDQLEAAGIVGTFEGSKAREVLIKDMTHLEQILKDIL